MSERVERNQLIIDQFRANGGQLGGGGLPLLLLTTTGARTGRRLTSPMAYATDGPNLVVFAANGGRPTHPNWFYNLRADPAAHVEVGTESFDVTATITEGAERDRLWAQQLRAAPFFADFQQRAGRTIPVITLSR
ncbi:nitroreductase/quinone reductase family protein [Streptomyces sp. NPDC088910]|uniref:nitroreductase/quinone reductase family protein n=1 Tax=Streptomyces sp. NPDC088910 TaxID=3365911 RepID=UPI00381558D2